MNSWQTMEIGEVLKYEQPQKYIVDNTDYLNQGTPVLTANKGFILGYTNEINGVYFAHKENPVIIFDDFTMDNKYVDFAFKIKSSAIKILKAETAVLTKFVFSAMQNISNEIGEHRRHYISEYQYYLIDIPNENEQKRIIGVLEVWDDYIGKLEQKIVLKEQLKKGLIIQLLSGKKRILGFTELWKNISLGDLIKENNNRTTESNQYRILSVTKKGIKLQSEHFNKQIASEDNAGYKIIKRGSLVFSTMNLWMGSLDILEQYDVGVISPSYKVFDVNNKLFNLTFAKELLTSSKMIWIYKRNSEQGASIVRRNLDLKSLLSEIVTVPLIEEQIAIANIIKCWDYDIELLKIKLDRIKNQRKYLLKNLISGKIRTPEDILTKGTK